jgi:hypothetical protein
LNRDVHLLKQILEFVVESLALNILVPHLKKKAQAGMTWVCINTIFPAMLRNGFIVCFEERAERE